MTNRTLVNWRREALLQLKALHSLPLEGVSTETLTRKDLNERILRLTQELIDLGLTQRGKSR